MAASNYAFASLKLLNCSRNWTASDAFALQASCMTGSSKLASSATCLSHSTSLAHKVARCCSTAASEECYTPGLELGKTAGGVEGDGTATEAAAATSDRNLASAAASDRPWASATATQSANELPCGLWLDHGGGAWWPAGPTARCGDGEGAFGPKDAAPFAVPPTLPACSPEDLDGEAGAGPPAAGRGIPHR
jgi:hypothetical protein